eukprot:Em0021g867a
MFQPFLALHGSKAFSICTPTVSPHSLVPLGALGTGHRSYASAEFKRNGSFVMNAFTGHMETSELFPYPEVLNDEQKENIRLLVEPTFKFFEEVNDAARNDVEEQVPPEIMKSLRELGAFGLQVPTELGGVGLTNTQYARLVEVVGGYDLAVGIALGAHQSIGFKGITLFGTKEQKEKYLPSLASGEKIAAFCLTEPSSGSDASSIRSKAVLSADGKHYILNGSKIWISNGGIAEVMTVFAQTPVKDLKTGEMKDKISAFIVERGFGGVASGPPEKKMGIKASNTAEVFYDNVHIPVQNLLGKEGEGFKVAMNILNNGRFGMAAALSGTMKKLIERAVGARAWVVWVVDTSVVWVVDINGMGYEHQWYTSGMGCGHQWYGIALCGSTVQHVTTRVQFGSKLEVYGDVQEKIARMAMMQYVTESIAYLLSGNMDRGCTEFQLEAAISKVYASEAAWEVVDECIQLHGGMGFMKAAGLERVMRDMRIFRIFEGSNDILRLFVSLTGLQYAGNHLRALEKDLKGFKLDVLMSEGVKRTKRMVGARTVPSIAGQVPADLAVPAEQLSSALGDFGASCEALLLTHRKDIINQQFLLKRLSNACVDLYGMAAVLSRASKALSKGVPTASHEKALTVTFCQQAQERIRRNLGSLRSPSHLNVDASMAAIAKEICKHGGAVPTHPLD